MQFRENIYYFKRIFKLNSASLKKQNLRNKKLESYLQLYRFNLYTENESIVDAIKKNEDNCYLYPLMARSFGD